MPALSAPTKSRPGHIKWLSPLGLRSMAYREWGDTRNPHILMCVHGLTRVGQDFETLAQALSNQMRILAPDMPGRGDSEWLADPNLYAIPLYVAACMTLLVKITAHRPSSRLDWLGTSMGGIIGMAVASLSNNPIHKLILNDIGPVLDPAGLKRIGHYVGQQKHFENIEQACQYIKTTSQTFGVHTEAQWLTLTRNVLVPDGHGFKLHYDPLIGEAFKNLSDDKTQAHETALWQTYDGITSDTLVIRGENSDLLSSQTAHEMQHRGPKAQRVDIPGVGHAPTFMNEKQIGIVREFLFN